MSQGVQIIGNDILYEGVRVAALVNATPSLQAEFCDLISELEDAETRKEQLEYAKCEGFNDCLRKIREAVSNAVDMVEKAA